MLITLFYAYLFELIYKRDLGEFAQRNDKNVNHYHKIKDFPIQNILIIESMEAICHHV